MSRQPAAVARRSSAPDWITGDVRSDNDANCFALSEASMMNSRNILLVMGLSGTDVSAAASVLNGEADYRSGAISPAKFGHMRLPVDANVDGV